jgi:formate hydrogenlyase transcriptional activator
MTNVSDDRYRALLDVSSAVAALPSVQAVLHSLRSVLSNISALHAAELWVLNNGHKTLQLFAFDRAGDAPSLGIGMEIGCTGVIAQVIDDQEPAYIANLGQEMVHIHGLEPFASGVGARSCYVFPVSTVRKQYGVIGFAMMHSGEVPPEDLELLRSLASHVAVALETALTTDRAQLYQRELAKERDRLRVLLEVNNDVVAQLDIIELFRSASASIRSYFHNYFTGFWLMDKQSNQLQCAVMDFPGGKGFLSDVEISGANYEKLRSNQAELLLEEQIEQLPAPIADNLKADSIKAIALAPSG